MKNCFLYLKQLQEESEDAFEKHIDTNAILGVIDFKNMSLDTFENNKLLKKYGKYLKKFII